MLIGLGMAEGLLLRHIRHERNDETLLRKVSGMGKQLLEVQGPRYLLETFRFMFSQ